MTVTRAQRLTPRATHWLVLSREARQTVRYQRRIRSQRLKQSVQELTRSQRMHGAAPRRTMATKRTQQPSFPRRECRRAEYYAR